MQAMWHQLTVLLSIFLRTLQPGATCLMQRYILHTIINTHTIVMMYKHYKSACTTIGSLMYPWFDTLWAACIIILCTISVLVNGVATITGIWSSLIVHKLFMLLFGTIVHACVRVIIGLTYYAWYPKHFQ